MVCKASAGPLSRIPSAVGSYTIRIGGEINVERSILDLVPGEADHLVWKRQCVDNVFLIRRAAHLEARVIVTNKSGDHEGRQDDTDHGDELSHIG